MRKLMFPIAGSVSLAVALATVSAAPVRVAAEPGSRLCGWTLQVRPTLPT